MSYKRETLEAKTSKELKRLCAHRLGIPGMWKKSKDQVVEAIMSKYGNKAAKAAKRAAVKAADGPAPTAPLAGIEGTFQSMITKPQAKFGDKTTTNVQVTCGANTGRFPVAGRKLSEVGEFLREVLNVDKLSTGMVNGKSESPDYVIKEGDVVEFMKPAGQKG